MASESNDLDEYERQFMHIKKLKNLEYLTSRTSRNDNRSGAGTRLDMKNESSRDFEAELNELNRASKLDAMHVAESINSESNLVDFSSSALDLNENEKAIEKINRKIARLDSLFTSFDAVKMVGPPEYYQKEPDPKTKERIIEAQELDNKKKRLFAGVYSMKSFIYMRKTNIPMPKSTLEDQETNSKMPKMVEVYQYLQPESMNEIVLPHDVSLDQVIEKALSSIQLLKRQPHYREFLMEQVYSELFKFLIHDTFWWCYLQRYQPLPKRQEKYFARVANNYVRLLFTQMNERYRDTFFKSLPDLLAMLVYTIFCTSFPPSCSSHFHDEFKDFLCTVTFLWITGSKPIIGSYQKWNLDKLDPPEAVFARKLLKKEKSKDADNSVKSSANMDDFINMINNSKNDSQSQTSFQTDKRSLGGNQASKEPVQSVRNSYQKIKESHESGPGPNFEECYLDTMGQSPLVEYYMYTQNARTVRNAQILVRHSHMLPKADYNHQNPTYDEIVQNSYKIIKKMEKELNEILRKQKEVSMSMEKQKMSDLNEIRIKRDCLLKSKEECMFVGGVIALNTAKDQNSTNFDIESAFNRAFQKYMHRQQQHSNNNKLKKITTNNAALAAVAAHNNLQQ